MKRKLAVFANGWGTEYLREVVTGIYEVAKEADIDVFTFVDFSSFSEQERTNNSEFNIFRLPEIRDFDCAVLMANSFNMQEEIDYVYKIVKESGIPAVSIEYDFDGITTINTDNYNGMYELAKHVVQEHGARHIVFVGGPKEHLESNIRLRAVHDVARESGFSLREEDILYGDWARNMPKALAKEWIDCHKCLPDIFICANDVMAMGVCDEMKELGYKVPEDVMVTGYDCVKLGQEYEPTIASVNHEWCSMGVKAMQLLLDKMAGIATEASVTMKTRFVSGGSCGCDSGEGIGYPSRKIDSLLSDSHFRHIYLAVRKAENADDLNRSLDSLFQEEYWMEGDNFMLCLEREFFNIEEQDENLRTQGYSDSMDVICSLKNGIPRPHQIMKCREAMFRVADENPQPDVYIFVPLYNEGSTYGFAMLTRDIDIVEDNYLYIWTRHMNQYLEQVRRNITITDLTRKLTMLSVTDVLTGVYNRAGCERIAYPMLEEWHKAGGTGAVMIADVDRMKTINDKYGHASGDLALRTVAAVLKAQLPEDWIISRFGGDEFFVGGKLQEGMDLETLRNSILQKLALEVERRQIPFDLRLSIGCVKLEPEGEIDLEGELRRADRLMYATKEEHHKEIDNK
ncbi:MAG: diguanylate cyclase [Acetatifactor sp.]